jgi:hypothetical protein
VRLGEEIDRQPRPLGKLLVGLVGVSGPVRILGQVEHGERQQAASQSLSDPIEREPRVDARSREPCPPDVSAAVGPLAGLGSKTPQSTSSFTKAGSTFARLPTSASVS